MNLLWAGRVVAVLGLLLGLAMAPLAVHETAPGWVVLPAAVGLPLLPLASLIAGHRLMCRHEQQAAPRTGRAR